MSIEAILPGLSGEIVVTYVPTANKRVRIRGYDQAQLIAREIAYKRKWKYAELLMRTGHARQVGASRQDRFKQLEKGLIPIKTDKIKNTHILLIDDVTTSGATIEASAKALKRAGAKKIDCAVFAQP